MNTFALKMNFIKNAANLYSWQLNALQLSYPMHILSLCSYWRRYQPIQSLSLA